MTNKQFGYRQPRGYDPGVRIPSEGVGFTLGICAMTLTGCSAILYAFAFM